MITKCRFCDYSKDTPLSEAILRVATEKDLPHEDWLLWVQRLVKQHGLKDWTSVKIHMGIKHKGDTYVGIWPEMAFTPSETAIINEADHDNQ